MESTANFLHLMGQIPEAIEQYTSQLNSSQSYELYILRGIAYLKLLKTIEASQDFQQGISLNESRFEAYYQQGLCALYSSQFQKAIENLQKSSKLAPESFQFQIQLQMQKARLELSNLQGSKNNICNYTWHQNDNYVKLEFPPIICDQKDIKSCFSNNSLDFEFVNENGVQKIHLDFEYPIEEEACKVELSVSQCQILIKKKKVGHNWDKVEKGLAQQGQIQVGVTSSKVKRDWSKIDKDIEKDLSKEKEGDPMNDLFKQIYSNGDEATRKAMIKSFQTSGGTVLSTNWKEVAEKEYEGKDRPSAPEGQQWNKW